MASKANKWGFKLLGVWLIIEGLIHLFDFSFDGIGTLKAVIALIAGALIIADR